MNQPLPRSATVQTRRLSPWRVTLAVLILAGLGIASYYSLQRWQTVQSQSSSDPWFASYVDVTSTPTYAFERLGAADTKDVVLSFIVSSSTDPCTPSWGNAYSLTEASESLDLDRRIERLRQQGGNVIVSFGGLINHEPAIKCTDKSKLLATYKSVIDRYKIDTIDFDLEGEDLKDTVAGARRAEVLAKLQSDLRSHNKKLAIWVTLPVAPQGLSEAGTNAVSQLLANKVDLAGVNVMTMDYGASKPANQSMYEAAHSALKHTHRQLTILYERADVPLSTTTVWSKIGATPMIGQNDEVNEVFSLTDAEKLNQFAREQGVGRMSMWSANRDIACGSNYVNLKIVSDSCSGVKQGSKKFAAILSKDFKGSFTLRSDIVTTSDKTSTKQTPDDPAKSPYQIWSSTGAYLKGTKVVWHHNVYQAKWWTKGDEPDSPVLQAWETPWELIGPVLPDEKPIPQATLPEGTYPNWSGTEQYEAGQRILFNGTPYQAKWWNQGESPAAASANADASPWAPLTQAQINAVKEGKE